LRQTGSVLYLAIDSLVPLQGRPLSGLEGFTQAMDRAGIPIVWTSSRTRQQLDDPRRKMGHSHPFIAEGGCGAYLPEGYFHLRPEKSARLGRFICIPVAEQQPAAADRLAELAEAASLEVVPLRTLSPRELAQNAGLPVKQADLLRQRDFDELFFLAGASLTDEHRLEAEARARKMQLRRHGAIWSAAVGASLPRCVGALAKLYDRALHRHLTTVAAATHKEAPDLFAACNRTILLSEGADPNGELDIEPIRSRRTLSLADPNLWDRLQELVVARG